MTGNKIKDKTVWEQINLVRRKYGFSEYSFQKDVKRMQKHFKDNLDSFTVQKIATTVWKVYETLLFRNGKKVYYKKYGAFNCLEGKSNKTGIRFKDGTILWNGLSIPVVINKNSGYEYQAIQSNICYCRIIRNLIRNKYKFYVQIVFKGCPPTKSNRNIGYGDVGIDIGTSTIAISSQTDVRIFELADKVQNIENQKRRLLRKMDRSRRATNPNNYNEDGTVKKQGNRKLVWNRSKHYLKYQNQLSELQRKQAVIRKYQHECLANYVISLGNKIYVEKMNFMALQKRSKNTEKNYKGRFKKKKRFGKSIANRAPSMLLTIIDRKLQYFETSLIEINTFEAKASQFNHFDQTYHKKTLSQRWNNFHGIKIQRDMYSAFLIMNISDDLKSFDINKCNDRFEQFYKLHNLEVQRLKGNKNLKSIAI